MCSHIICIFYLFISLSNKNIYPVANHNLGHIIICMLKQTTPAQGIKPYVTVYCTNIQLKGAMNTQTKKVI